MFEAVRDALEEVGVTVANEGETLEDTDTVCVGANDWDALGEAESVGVEVAEIEMVGSARSCWALQR